MSMNELQRIGRVLGVKTDVDDKMLCLLIQDKIKKKNKEIEEKTFCYHMVKAQNERLKSKIHNLKNEFAESIGINEYMMLKKSHESLKKNYKKTLEDNHQLRSSIEQYRENEFKDRLKKIRIEVI